MERGGEARSLGQFNVMLFESERKGTLKLLPEIKRLFCLPAREEMVKV